MREVYNLGLVERDEIFTHSSNLEVISLHNFFHLSSYKWPLSKECTKGHNQTKAIFSYLFLCLSVPSKGEISKSISLGGDTLL